MWIRHLQYFWIVRIFVDPFILFIIPHLAFSLLSLDLSPSLSLFLCHLFSRTRLILSFLLSSNLSVFSSCVSFLWLFSFFLDERMKLIGSCKNGQDFERMNKKKSTDIIVYILNRYVLSYSWINNTLTHTLTHVHEYTDNGHYSVLVTNYCCCTG